MRKKKKNDEIELEKYEENLDEDIAEIKEELSGEYFEEDKIEKNKKTVKIINIIFIVLIVMMCMIAVDVVAVARYNTGPFFAIKMKTYKDGGTKVYYGLGYKVIKYNQIQGRRDKQIGFWTMPYNTEAINTSSLDLAIEFTENPTKSYGRYYKKFMRISSTLQSIDEKNKEILLGYTDEDGKYTLNIVCKMADDKIPSSLETNKEVTVIGTVSDFKLKTSKEANKLYIKDCFAEQ